MKVEMTAQEKARTSMMVNVANRSKGLKSADERNELGRDAFMKILVAQLRHQDPTKPLEDREFISQMAQFSSLEQMQRMNNEIRTMLSSTKSSEAYALLGRTVDAYNQTTGKKVSGPVQSVKHGADSITLVVGNEEINLKDISAVHVTEPRKKAESKSVNNFNLFDFLKIKQKF